MAYASASSCRYKDFRENREATQKKRKEEGTAPITQKKHTRKLLGAGRGMQRIARNTPVRAAAGTKIFVGTKKRKMRRVPVKGGRWGAMSSFSDESQAGDQAKIPHFPPCQQVCPRPAMRYAMGGHAFGIGFVLFARNSAPSIDICCSPSAGRRGIARATQKKPSRRAAARAPRQGEKTYPKF